MTLTEEQALERAEEAGIHRLRIPTPFAVGRVNCYLLEDDPLTLIDTGPNSGKALDELQRQLAEHGHAIEDLELIILTHQRIDHLGLVEILVEHSGAEVAAIDVAVRRMANFGEDAEADDEFAAGLMLRHGIPENVVYALQSVSRSFRGWGAKAQVTRPLQELRIVSDGVNAVRGPNLGVLMITHYQRLLNHIVPDFVHVMYDGRLVKSGDKSLALELETRGYDWVKEFAAVST